MGMGLNPDVEGSGGFEMRAGSGGRGAGCWGGIGLSTLGVSGLFGLDRTMVSFTPVALIAPYNSLSSLPFPFPPLFDCLLGISLGPLARLHFLESDLMAVGIRVTMFVILSNILKLFFAHCNARPKGLRDLGLNTVGIL